MFGSLFSHHSATLVGIILSFIVCTSGENIGLGSGLSGELSCYTPCADASGASGISLPPCHITIKGSCPYIYNERSREAPGAPGEARLDSSSYIATDGQRYLEMIPQWTSPSENIHLLTGYEAQVRCTANDCNAETFCVRIDFNRTLTVNETRFNMSLTCQYGDFARPGSDYTLVVRSLPGNLIGNQNEMRIEATLPSCKDVPDLHACTSGNSIPSQYDLGVFQDSSGNVIVTFSPDSNSGYTDFLVGIENVNDWEIYFEEIVTLSGNGQPHASFQNVPEGTYRAFIMIEDCEDCAKYESRNVTNIKAVPIPASSTTSPAPSNTSTTSFPNTPVQSTTGVQDPTRQGLLWVALSGALGGVLLVVLILVVVLLTWKRSTVPSQEFQETKVKGEGDYDSLAGSGCTNPGMNGTIVPDDPRYTSPSILPATVHHDNLANGRLLLESQYYADSMPYKEMDSISKVVDIPPPERLINCNRCDQPDSPDSGLESVYSDSAMEDGKTLFSIALTSLGEEV
ncbi:uncharacterized protein LOC121411793 isoform X2 [Lytechinus variegatus]|uniref:uncharacterized protein LOC121411793 isoform X2 n=1 Tax=Lytechinus variegatus TaxID=7654 RepID=UPI001BB10363|nr:uncharacterized protein LOC121411793 isoform X2 [Lytechinus variegatus]